MAKPEKKSITDLIATKPLSRKPSVAEIDAITSKIHEQGSFPGSNGQSQPSPEMEKVKRISVNAPIQLYLQAKTKSTLQDQTLMTYIIRLIKADVRN